LRLLLDTHALIWWLAGDARLSVRPRDAIDQYRSLVFVSAASAWEIATKVRIGKLPGAAAIAPDIPSVISRENFQPLAVTVEHGQRAGTLLGPLRDPFDRMLTGDARQPPSGSRSSAPSTPTGSCACGEPASLSSSGSTRGPRIPG
jgi:PIN domain nuclease of toxin-antitoxin system